MGLNDVRTCSVPLVPQPDQSHEVALYRHLLDPQFASITLHPGCARITSTSTHASNCFRHISFLCGRP
jgi:hypothetical protein